MFMSAAAPIDPPIDPPVATTQPDPPRSVPQRVSQVLGLLHILVTYGKQLAAALGQYADHPQDLPGFFSLIPIFRTTDLTLMLDRIARGLLRAAALEARLHRLAERGRDLAPSRVRMPASRKAASRKAATSGPAVPTDDGAHDLTPRAEACDTSLLTLDDIIASDCNRPIGAILVDICDDLGIVPGDMDRTTWDLLLRYIVGYGGSVVTLLSRRRRPGREEIPDGDQGYITGLNPIPIAPPGRPAPQSPPQAGTGPP